MRIKRVLIIVAIIAMSLLAVTACDGNNGAKTIESLTIANGTDITARYGVDSGLQLDVKAKYKGSQEQAATKDNVTYSSDTPLVASVNDTGYITIHTVGTAKITVTSVNKDSSGKTISKTVNLTVAETIEGMTVANGYILGGTDIDDGGIQLAVMVKYVAMQEKIATSSDVTYVSSNPAVATVSDIGYITVLAEGSVQITVTSKNKDEDGIKITRMVVLTVPRMVESFMLEGKDSYSLIWGYDEETIQLSAKIKYFLEPSEKQAGKNDITYASTNPEVAEVDENGFVTIKALGECQILIITKYAANDGIVIQKTVDIKFAKLMPHPQLPSAGAHMNGDYISFRFKNITKETIYFYALEICFINASGKVIETLLVTYTEQQSLDSNWLLYIEIIDKVYLWETYHYIKEIINEKIEE